MLQAEINSIGEGITDALNAWSQIDENGQFLDESLAPIKESLTAMSQKLGRMFEIADATILMYWNRELPFLDKYAAIAKAWVDLKQTHHAEVLSTAKTGMAKLLEAATTIKIKTIGRKSDAYKADVQSHANSMVALFEEKIGKLMNVWDAGCLECIASELKFYKDRDLARVQPLFDIFKKTRIYVKAEELKNSYKWITETLRTSIGEIERNRPFLEDISEIGRLVEHHMNLDLDKIFRVQHYTLENLEKRERALHTETVARFIERSLDFLLRLRTVSSLK